jgi:hypothetical protein
MWYWLTDLWDDAVLRMLMRRSYGAFVWLWPYFLYQIRYSVVYMLRAYFGYVLRLFRVARGLLPRVKNGRNGNFGVTSLPESLSGIENIFVLSILF